MTSKLVEVTVIVTSLKGKIDEGVIPRIVGTSIDWIDREADGADDGGKIRLKIDRQLTQGDRWQDQVTVNWSDNEDNIIFSALKLVDNEDAAAEE